MWFPFKNEKQENGKTRKRQRTLFRIDDQNDAQYIFIWIYATFSTLRTVIISKINGNAAGQEKNEEVFFLFDSVG